MNNVPEFVYNRLLSMGEDEFQRERTYIYTHTSSKTVVYFGETFCWNRAYNSHPLSDAVYQTTVGVARCVMEEAKRFRSL